MLSPCTASKAMYTPIRRPGRVLGMYLACHEAFDALNPAVPWNLRAVTMPQVAPRRESEGSRSVLLITLPERYVNGQHITVSLLAPRRKPRGGDASQMSRRLPLLRSHVCRYVCAC